MKDNRKKKMRETDFINMTIINCSFGIAVNLMIVITDNQTINNNNKKMNLPEKGSTNF